MTPEQLEKKVLELEQRLDQFNSFSTIPFSVDKAWRERFKDILEFEAGSKTASSENQAVNEAGSSTYNVLGVPVGFLEFESSGTTYYVPYYNA